MKTITIELRPFLMGVFCTLFFMMLISSQQNTPNDQVGTYQTAVCEEGFIVLDTRTGRYILRPGWVSLKKELKWVRGDFRNAYANGIPGDD